MVCDNIDAPPYNTVENNSVHNIKEEARQQFFLFLK